MEWMNISDIRFNEDNPRKISKENLEKLQESLKRFPEMLEIRPIVVDENNITLGGNMRLQALQNLGYDKIPVLKVENLSEEEKKEFIIKDNLSYGDWDWEIISTEWDIDLLQDWGMDMEGFDVSPDDFSEDFNLDDSAKQPFQQMTFKLADEQVQVIDEALNKIKQSQEFKYVETFGNENSTGNALYLLVMEWAGQKK